MSYGRTVRENGSHAMTILCEGAQKGQTACAMVLPMAAGSVEPVDVSEYSGVEFEARAEGAGEVTGTTRGPAFRLPFQASPKWQRVRVLFEKARRNDLLQLEWAIRPEAGTKGWLELDNVRLYK
jgi:hypothetical protein